MFHHRISHSHSFLNSRHATSLRLQIFISLLRSEQIENPYTDTEGVLTLEADVSNCNALVGLGVICLVYPADI